MDSLGVNTKINGVVDQVLEHRVEYLTDLGKRYFDMHPKDSGETTLCEVSSHDYENNKVTFTWFYAPRSAHQCYLQLLAAETDPVRRFQIRNLMEAAQASPTL